MEWPDRQNVTDCKMLPTANEENASVAVSSEIAAYSFDRVVVCEHAEIAQQLPL